MRIDGSLSLERLECRHAADLVRASNDPELARQARLTPFADAAAAAAWLGAQSSDPCQHEFAVMHDRRGFLGALSLRAVQRLGHLSIWLQREHQNQGFGGLAVSLMLRRCDAVLGVDYCFAAVGRTNLRSLGMFGRVGFERLPLTVIQNDDDDDLVFMVRQRPGARHISVAPLRSGISEIALRLQGAFGTDVLFG